MLVWYDPLYTQMDSKIGNLAAPDIRIFEATCIAQLIQVVLLRRPLRCFKYTLPALPNSQFLNPFVYRGSIPLEARHHPKGIIYILLAWLCATLMTLLTRFATQTVPLSTILLFQNVIGLLTLLPILKSRGLGLFKTSRLPFLIFRSLLSLTAIGFSFVAVQKISLVNTMLFTNAAPLWIPFVCLLWLKVPIRHILWPGLIGGFLGIILILQPGGDVINAATLFALAAGVLQSINMVSIRELSHTERSHTVMFYYFLVCTVVCLPWSMIEWVQPSSLAWGQIIAIGALLTCGQWTFVRAFHHASASDLGPFCYSAVVYSLFIDWVLYNQGPDLWAWLGIILICAGGIWAIRTNQSKKLNR